MKYLKHITLKDWNKFQNILKDAEGNFVPPGNDFQYRNHFTGKIESLQTITAQEVLLSKYQIIIDAFEPKWTRRYHKITKYVNMKNFNKGLMIFDKSIQIGSKKVEQVETNVRQNKKNQKILRDKKSNRKSRNSLKIWSDTDNFGY